MLGRWFVAAACLCLLATSLAQGSEAPTPSEGPNSLADELGYVAPPTTCSTQIDGNQWGRVRYVRPPPPEAEDGAGEGDEDYRAWAEFDGELGVEPRLRVPRVQSLGEGGEAEEVRNLSGPVARFAMLYHEESGSLCIETCTAMFLGGGLFLTNYHCAFPQRARVRHGIQRFDRVSAEIRIGYLDAGHAGRRFVLDVQPFAHGHDEGAGDFAIYLVPEAFENSRAMPQPVRFSPFIEGGAGRGATFDRNANVAIVGHPWGTPLHASYNNCRITNLTLEGRARTLTYACPAWPGNSGSPVFDLNTGAVIGLHRQMHGATYINDVLGVLPPGVMSQITAQSGIGQCRVAEAHGDAVIAQAEDRLEADGVRLQHERDRLRGPFRVHPINFGANEVGLREPEAAELQTFVATLTPEQRARAVLVAPVLTYPGYCIEPTSPGQVADALMLADRRRNDLELSRFNHEPPWDGFFGDRNAAILRALPLESDATPALIAWDTFYLIVPLSQ